MLCTVLVGSPAGQDQETKCICHGCSDIQQPHRDIRAIRTSETQYRFGVHPGALGVGKCEWDTDDSYKADK
jgi:hypothetical protein